jgi:hypothetical protein
MLTGISYYVRLFYDMSTCLSIENSPLTYLIDFSIAWRTEKRMFFPAYMVEEET